MAHNRHLLVESRYLHSLTDNMYSSFYSRYLLVDSVDLLADSIYCRKCPIASGKQMFSSLYRVFTVCKHVFAD